MKIGILTMAENAATAAQTEELARALANELGEPDTKIAHHYLLGPDGQPLKNNTTVVYPDLLSKQEISTLPYQGKPLPLDRPYDILVGCRPEVMGPLASIKRAQGNEPKLVQIQHPNGAPNKDGTRPYHHDLGAIDAIVLQPHEYHTAAESPVAARQSVYTKMALHGITRAVLEPFNRAANPNKPQITGPSLAVLVGGPDDSVEIWTPDYFHTLAADIRGLDQENHYKNIFVITSRRTGDAGKAILAADLADLPHVGIDTIDYKTALANADDLDITGESLSMVTEAAKAAEIYNHRFTVDMLGGRLETHRLAGHFHTLEDQKIIRFSPTWHTPDDAPPPNEGPQLAKKIVPLLHLA